MWKNSTKRSLTFIYILTLLCPGQITALFLNSVTNEASATETETNEENSSDSFSLLSWILGESPTAEETQEVNFVSAQLDQSINEELSLTSERSVILRRRSPDDPPADSSTPWYAYFAQLWPMIQGAVVKSEDQTANFQSDQLNKELTNALMSPTSSGGDPFAMNDKTNAKDPTTINGMTPIEIFRYYMPDGQSEDAVMAVYSWWNDPANTNYVRAIVICWKVVAFCTPGLGIIEQINFTVAVTKLIWKTTKMYCEGSDMGEITVAILPDLAYLIVMYRRDEEYLSEHTLKLGQAVDISTMDTPDFVKYIHSLQFPALPEEKEAELRADVTSMIDKYYKNTEIMADNQKEYMVDVILNVTKFLSFFKPQGSIKTTPSDAVREKIFTNAYASVMNQM